MKIVCAFCCRYPARASHRASALSRAEVSCPADAAASSNAYSRTSAPRRMLQFMMPMYTSTPASAMTIRAMPFSNVDTSKRRFVQPRHPDQADRLHPDHARNHHRPDAAAEKCIQPVGVGAPHQEPEDVRDEEHDANRGVRLDRLRADTPC